MRFTEELVKEKLENAGLNHIEIVHYCGTVRGDSTFLDKDYGEFIGKAYDVYSNRKMHPSRRFTSPRKWQPHRNERNWSETLDSLFISVYSTESFSNVRALFPQFSKNQLRVRGRQLGILPKNVTRRMGLCHDFFKTPNVVNCYWAGFMAADGCVYDKSVILSIKDTDSSHVEKFTNRINNVLKPGHSRNSGLGSKMVTTSIRSKEMVEDLEEVFSITPKKTHTLQPPSIKSEDLVLAFCAGLLDGDGYISFSYSDGREYIRFGLCGASSVIQWFQEVLNSILLGNGRKPTVGFKMVPPQHSLVPSNYSTFLATCTGINACILLEKMYDLVSSEVLMRKWDKFLGFRERKIWKADFTKLEAPDGIT